MRITLGPLYRFGSLGPPALLVTPLTQALTFEGDAGQIWLFRYMRQHD